MAKKTAKKAAKKATKPARQPEPQWDNRDGEKLSAEELKRFQGMMERVGRQESRGVIYIIELKKDNPDMCDGVLFAHNMSNADIAGNMLNELKLDPLTMLALTMHPHGHRHD